MDAYVKLFDELPRKYSVKYTFTGRDDTFLIFAFFRNDEVSPLDILTTINVISNKLGLSEF